MYPALYHADLLGRIPPPSGYAVVNYQGVIPEEYSSGDKFLDGNLVRPEIFESNFNFSRLTIR